MIDTHEQHPRPLGDAQHQRRALPRETVRLVAMSTTGAVKVHVGSDVFALATGLLNKGKIRAFLTASGGVLNASMQPKVPPTYASKTGPREARGAKYPLYAGVLN